MGARGSGRGGGVTDVCSKRKRQHCSDHSVAGISPLNTPTDIYGLMNRLLPSAPSLLQSSESHQRKAM